MNFDKIYIEALENVLHKGKRETNKRTGTDILATHGYSFSYDMNYLPVLYLRKVWIRSAAAELAWFLSGSKHAGWINDQTTIWKEFTDKDGNIPTAYGYRWSKAFGYDQVDNIMHKLRNDPTSRQQVLLSWNPMVDNVKPAANIPCPLIYIINIIDNKLNIHLTLRSNDVWLGLPYDVMTACLLGRALANSLNVELGELFYSIAHMHLYENQWSLASEAILRYEANPKGIHLKNDNKFNIASIRSSKTAYVESFFKGYVYSGWTPKVDVVR